MIIFFVPFIVFYRVRWLFAYRRIQMVKFCTLSFIICRPVQFMSIFCQSPVPANYLSIISLCFGLG